MEVIKLTESAQVQAKELLARESEAPAGLRVEAVAGSCNNLQYRIGWDNPKEGDEVFTYPNGMVVMVDQKSSAMLKGSVLEFHNTSEGSGFEVINPRSTGCSGCECGNGSNV